MCRFHLRKRLRQTTDRKINAAKQRPWEEKQPMAGYRHEYKYICSMSQLLEIRERIRPFMHLDPAAEAEGAYTVRSLYFDDHCNRCLRENLDGTDPREKFRIRIYNGELRRARLELKQKRQGMTRKLSCPLPEDTLGTILSGRPPAFTDTAPLLQQLVLEMHTRLLRPRIIVEYDRIPYVYRDGNVRITLDMDIRSSADTALFGERRIPGRLLMPARLHVLEVKFDDFLPQHIFQAAQIRGLRRTSFSKYALCAQHWNGRTELPVPSGRQSMFPESFPE